MYGTFGIIAYSFSNASVFSKNFPLHESSCIFDRSLVFYLLPHIAHCAHRAAVLFSTRKSRRPAKDMNSFPKGGALYDAA
jgi:hypothetical protein